MSFEKRHRRQLSSADPNAAKEDTDDRSFRPGDDFDKTILHIQRKLDQIPSQFKTPLTQFNPLEQVIDMMKSSNLKEKKKELDANVKTLDKSMEGIVKAHYDGFNKSIKNYTKILQHVQETGTNNSTLSNFTAKCNVLFTSRSHSVNTMYLQSLEYSYMIEILDKIDAIKKVPEQFQDAFSSQEYLLSAKILVEAVDKLYQDDLLKIGALVELQADIVGKKNTFHETAIELLHNLIYLKDEVDLEDLAAAGAVAPGLEVNKKQLTSSKTMDSQDKINAKLGLMDQLVSALFVLGKSSVAINKILERLRPELRHLIQKAVAIVKKPYEKNPVLLQQILSRPPRGDKSASDFPNLFANMLHIAFNKITEIIGYHKYVTMLFEDKLKQQQNEAMAESALTGRSGAKLVRLNDNSRNSGSSSNEYEAMISTYRLEHVWEEFQLELQSLIGYYIQAPTEVNVNSLTSSHSGSKLNSKSHPNGANGSALNETDGSAHQGSRLFSFSNSSAYTLYEVSETQSFQYRSMDLGDPSCYNLPSIYPLITTFCDAVTQVIAAKTPSTRLQEWIDNFITFEFLATVKMDYKARVDIVLQSAEAFKSRDAKAVKLAYNADDARRPLLNSAVEVWHCLKELYEDAMSMPSYTPSIHGIMENCLLSYYDQSRSKYEEYIKDSEVGKTVRNVEFQKLVLTDPSWKRVIRVHKLGGSLQSASKDVAASSSITTQNEDSAAPSTSSNNTNPIDAMPPRQLSIVQTAGMSRSPSASSDAQISVDQEEREYLFNLMEFEAAWHTGTTNAGLPIQVKHMIMDPARLTNLASLHDSLYWIADKVSTLDKSDSNSGNKKGHHRDQSISAKPISSNPVLGPSPATSAIGLSSISPPLNRRNVQNGILQRTNSKEGRLIPANLFHPKLSSSLINLTWMLKELSDQCLQNIYVDFRLQTCYFLDRISKNYVYAAEDRSPDPAVVDLNSSLNTSFQFLQAYLPPGKLKYLLGGLPALMSSLLIESLKAHIETINRNGVVKMVRNVFSLQQNLTSMTTFNEEPFDKVRRYYTLLNLNLEEVYTFISQHHHVEDVGSYTLNQYRTILELVASPKSRSLSDEQEKDLREKYVLTPGKT